jgi:hypothetical protein
MRDKIRELRAELLSELARRDEIIARLGRRIDRLALDDDDRQELAARPPGEWVSFKQGAAEAGRGLSTLYDLRKSGSVPELREGGRVLVERTAIAALVAARKARA